MLLPILLILLAAQCHAASMQLLHAQRSLDDISYDVHSWKWGGVLIQRLTKVGKLRIWAQGAPVHVAYARLRGGKNLCFTMELDEGRSNVIFEPTSTDSIIISPAPSTDLNAMCLAAIHFYWDRVDEARALLTTDDYAHFGVLGQRSSKVNDEFAETIIVRDNPLVCAS